jgi:hypothetical protein
LGLPTSNCLRKSASWDLSQLTEYFRQVTGSKKEPEFLLLAGGQARTRKD